MTTSQATDPAGNVQPRKRHTHRFWYILTGTAAAIFISGVAIVVAAIASIPSATSSTASVGQSAPASGGQQQPAQHHKDSTYNLPIGSTITVTDDNEGAKWTVTVNSVHGYQPGEYDFADTPAGTHLVDANVTYRAVKGTASPNPLDWETKTSAGQTHESQTTGNDTELLSNDIKAGQVARGDVIVAVANGQQRTSTLVYTNGFGEAGSWSLHGTSQPSPAAAPAAAPAAPAPAAAPAAQPAAQPAGLTVAGIGSQGETVYAGANTSAEFALNVEADYAAGDYWHQTGTSSFWSYSPVTGQSYLMASSSVGNPVVITGGNGALVQFSMAG